MSRSHDAWCLEPTVAQLIGLPVPNPTTLARGSASDLSREVTTERTRRAPVPILALIGVFAWGFTIAFAVTAAIATAL